MEVRKHDTERDNSTLNTNTQHKQNGVQQNDASNSEKHIKATKDPLNPSNGEREGLLQGLKAGVEGKAEEDLSDLHGEQHGGHTGVVAAAAPVIIRENECNVDANTALASAVEVVGGSRVEQPPGGPPGRIGKLLHWMYPTGFRKELKSLFFLSWPVVVTQILHYTIGTVAIIFGGHRGKLELDIIALSTSVLSVTAITVSNGLAGYCDTLFAQVYGSKDRKRLGVVLQKCIIVIMLGLFPCLAIHVNLEQTLLFLGHDHQVARLTEEYVLIFIPGTVGFFCYIVLSKYVQNQNREIPIMVIAFLANGVNIILHCILFVWLKTDVWGSAVAQSISYCSFFVFTSIYILLSRMYKETWSGWSSACLLSWGPYFKLGVYGLLQHCVEWWAFEAGIILTGPLGFLAVGAQSIIYQCALILYTIAWGIGLGGGIRTGQFLGAMDPKAAKTSCAVTLTVAIVCGVFIMVMVLSLRNVLPFIFTSDPEVVELVASVLPIIAVEEIFDFLAGATNGILRGCGRQAVGMVITIPAFGLVLFVGIPLMLKTSFHIKAFWVCVLVTLLIQAVAGTLYLSRLNWMNEAKEAQKRIKISGGGSTEEEKDPNLQKDILNGEAGSAPQQLLVTKRLICLRLLTFALSIGVLVVGLVIRIILKHHGHPGGVTNHPHNLTETAYIVNLNSTSNSLGYNVDVNATII